MAIRWGKLYEGTPSEKVLEDAVAALGVPYRTQFPGWKYGARFFPDFFLPTLGIIIEVDDSSHDHKTEADAERTATLEEVWGARVVRCTNEQAQRDPHGTVRALLASIGLWPIPSGLPKLADALPKTRKAPRKERRNAKVAARRRRRVRKSPSRTRNE